MDSPQSTPWGYVRVAASCVQKTAASLQRAVYGSVTYTRRHLRFFLNDTSDEENGEPSLPVDDAAALDGEDDGTLDVEDAFLHMPCCQEGCHNAICPNTLLQRRREFMMMQSHKKQFVCYIEMKAFASPRDSSGVRHVVACKIDGHNVCIRRYQHNSYLGTRAWKHLKMLVESGKPFVPTNDAGGRGGRNTSTQRNSFNEDMEALTLQFGESMPNQVVYYPPDRHKKRPKLARPLVFLHCGIFADMEEVFNDMRRRGVVGARTPSRTMRKWWKESWWHVKIKSWQPFAKCDACVKFRARILVAATGPLRDEISLQQSLHRSRISIGRIRYDLREQLSKTYPGLFLHASIDAMDNKKTNIPQTRHLSHTKKNAGGELLKTRIMGK